MHDFRFSNCQVKPKKTNTSGHTTHKLNYKEFARDHHYNLQGDNFLC